MKLILVRHAQTNYNLHHLMNSDPSVDVHLTELGTRQARKLAHDLKDSNYDVVYISELSRTKETADIINEQHGKAVIVDGRLNDNKSGFENQTVQVWYDALDASDDKFNARFNEGESYNDIFERVSRFMEDLKTKDYDTVLMVTHRLITQMIYVYLEHRSLEHLEDFEVKQGLFAKFDII
ncbi:MAG: phosphoglycerate mutase [Candidatus Saccharibacteria bacterium]|nr:phosphoglycerate mutase [Candidatus Saccharibacteria bacterium]